MIIKLPIHCCSCCVSDRVLLQVKNKAYLKINELRPDPALWTDLVSGVVKEVVHGAFENYYLIEVLDTDLISDCPQLYIADISKYECAGLAINYIDEKASQSGLPYVATDATLQGLGISSSPLGVDVDIIDGRH